VSQVFSREYYWSPAYSFFKKPYYIGQKWHDLEVGPIFLKKILLHTAQFHLWETEYDCSKESAICYLKPTDALFKGLKMRFGKVEGELVNNRGEVICFDPSIVNESVSCLVVRKEELVGFLKRNHLRVFWVTQGEKLFLGGTHPPKGREGRCEISGLYHLQDSSLLGKIKTKTNFY
jgi:hypothetical protein